MKKIELVARQSLETQLSPKIAKERLNEHHVRIQTSLATICGSDLTYFNAKQLPYQLKYPLILGHEMTGRVAQVGAKVSGIQIGDKVAVDPNINCGNCSYCRKNLGNFCEKMQFMASRGFPGAMQEYLDYPAANLYVLPPDWPDEIGTLIEPLSVAYAAIKLAQIKEEPTAMIIGAGSIGILTYNLLTQLFPQLRCCLIERSDKRIQQALHVGVPEQDIMTLADFETNFSTQKVNLIFDTSGAVSAIEAAIKQFLYKNGKVILVGLSNDSLKLTLKELVYQGIHLIGSYRFDDTFSSVIQLIKNGLSVFPIISEIYPSEKAQIAFQRAQSEETIKVGIRFN